MGALFQRSSKCAWNNGTTLVNKEFLDEAKKESLKRLLEEIVQGREGLESENAQEAEPISLADQCGILIKCFGERRGTEIRGLGGAARWPAKKRGGPWTMEGA